MGYQTDQTIKAWRERAGLELPSPEQRERLERMKAEATSLLEVLVLELAGIRDGDGRWHGCNPIDEIIRDLQILNSGAEHPMW
jgi:hypothetical protein